MQLRQRHLMGVLRSIVFALGGLFVSTGAWAGPDIQPNVPLVQGTVWQPDHSTVNPKGLWHQIGARQLLIQWSVVDATAFVSGAKVTAAEQLPDWDRIAKEPWAEQVILGLAGHFDENLSRKNYATLIELSQQLASLPTPLHVVGWYFPVEVDPTWGDVTSMAKLLDRLPRPLWISVYDNLNRGPEALGDFIARWLPADVGIFFQDGVGVHARSAEVALDYANTLSARFGKNRVKIIAEAFRPQINGGFRAATKDELMPQIRMYADHSVFLFDGPHYVSDALVDELRRASSIPHQ
jgi:hypothetical protein